MPVTSKYGRTPPNKHGGVGRQQQQWVNSGLVDGKLWDGKLVDGLWFGGWMVAL